MNTDNLSPELRKLLDEDTARELEDVAAEVARRMQEGD